MPTSVDATAVSSSATGRSVPSAVARKGRSPGSGSAHEALRRYDELIMHPKAAPAHWAPACTHEELTLHQLSPYIGKLKSVIANHLIEMHTKPGQLVVDPFCGSGTVPLEAVRLGRRVFASDAGAYAITLTRAKLAPPPCKDKALHFLDRLSRQMARVPDPDLDKVPPWVRRFFHPRTLAETIKIAQFLKSRRQHFYLAALLGILHHQRPGFLSYPSSALVPYLRTNNFPRNKFPQLYEYRPVIPRLRAKISRALKRPPQHSPSALVVGARRALVQNVDLPDAIDCIVTSPPYMNALDYVRDNRLRLWLLGASSSESRERDQSSRTGFRASIAALSCKVEKRANKEATCVFVVGEQVKRSKLYYPSRDLAQTFLTNAPSFELSEIIRDHIPDVRRSRQEQAGVKTEHVLVFRRTR